MAKDLHLGFNSLSGETKQQGLISELMRLIRTELREGDSLPSVNTLSRELNLSRDTVFKAYTELKKRKLVRSAPTKGYYVSHEISRVLLLLDYYSPFKDEVYRAIEKHLGESYSIDLVFHHYNRKLFDSVVLDSAGRYDAYIIMNFDVNEFRIAGSLRNIEPSRLLFLDIPIEDWKDLHPEKYSWVWQDFNHAVLNALQTISGHIGKYSRFVFVNPEQLKHHSVTLQAFSRFCLQHDIRSHIVRTSSRIDVKKGDAYFVLRQRDLTHILGQCREKAFRVGADVGILVYNDTPLYEFVAEGITVISTDFCKMGRLAGEFITGQQKPIRQVVQPRVIIRNSL